MSEIINHPRHYNAGKIEVIEFIEDQQLHYHLGNAIKYISRAGKKNPATLVEDLEKAIWYLRRRIELESPAPRRPNDMINPLEKLQLNLNEWVMKQLNLEGGPNVDTQKV